MTLTAEKQKALDAAIQAIEKDQGKNIIMRLGDKPDNHIASTPTGSLNLDFALGIGGIPKGRIIEIYGPESGGKTTLALHMIAETQKSGGVCVFVDAEHALDPGYAKNIGVDIENLYFSQPDSGEAALEVVESCIRSSAVDLIVVDSVAALTPRAEIDGNMGDTHVGLLARLMSQAMRKLTSIASSTGCTVVFINQIREKVGIMFGNPETTTGGRALKFYSSVRLEVRKADAIKLGGEVVGSRTKVKVVKNKVAPPMRTAEFDVIYGKGISTMGEVIDLGTEHGILSKSGAWYSYQGNKIGQGRENTKLYLEEHPDIYEKLYKTVRSLIIDGEVPSEFQEDCSSAVNQ